MEKDEDERDTSIKGRLLMLVNKIKSQSYKAQEPIEKKQAAPCKEILLLLSQTLFRELQFLLNVKCRLAQWHRQNVIYMATGKHLRNYID